MVVLRNKAAVFKFDTLNYKVELDYNEQTPSCPTIAIKNKSDDQTAADGYWCDSDAEYLTVP